MNIINDKRITHRKTTKLSLKKRKCRRASIFDIPEPQCSESVIYVSSSSDEYQNDEDDKVAEIKNELDAEDSDRSVISDSDDYKENLKNSNLIQKHNRLENTKKFLDKLIKKYDIPQDDTSFDLDDDLNDKAIKTIINVNNPIEEIQHDVSFMHDDTSNKNDVTNNSLEKSPLLPVIKVKKKQTEKMPNLPEKIPDSPNPKWKSDLDSDRSVKSDSDDYKENLKNSNLIQKRNSLENTKKFLNTLIKKYDIPEDDKSFDLDDDINDKAIKTIDNVNNLIEEIQHDVSLMHDDTSNKNDATNNSLEISPLLPVIKVKKKQTEKIPDSPEPKTPESNVECFKMLDEFYGKSWRSNKKQVMSKTEKKIERKTKAKTQNIPKTDIKRNESPLYKNPYLQLSPVNTNRNKKDIKSPWVEIFKRICDDESSDEELKIETPYPRKKLFSSAKKDGNDAIDKKQIKIRTAKESNETKKCPSSELNFQSNVNKKPNRNPRKSFLSSLSLSVPAKEADPSARMFREGYKKLHKDLASRLFKMYNEDVFDNKLPADMEISWNPRLITTAGRCHSKKIIHRNGTTDYCSRIELSTKILNTADRLRDTLIHELCHAAAYVINRVNDGHGPVWKYWSCKAMRTYPELPPIKRCHSYNLHTKYLYKCTGCGYRFGRHTKSISVEKKRCGHCHGKFEILINKETKDGTKEVASNKRPPNAFALFVKENYASVKTTDMKHAEVMKLLGAKFKDIKIDNE